MSVGTALKRSADATRLRRMVGDDHANERHADDFYPTPPEATEALLTKETFAGPVWEPACGDGAISKVLQERGLLVLSTDLVDRGYGEPRVDFLMERAALAPNIITNPPFKLFVPFVERAVALATGKVAMLARITVLEGKARKAFYHKHPPSRVWVFSERLTFHRGGITTRGGGMLAFAWFVWEHGYSGKPELGWI